MPSQKFSRLNRSSQDLLDAESGSRFSSCARAPVILLRCRAPVPRQVPVLYLYGKSGDLRAGWVRAGQGQDVRRTVRVQYSYAVRRQHPPAGTRTYDRILYLVRFCSSKSCKTVSATKKHHPKPAQTRLLVQYCTVLRASWPRQ